MLSAARIFWILKGMEAPNAQGDQHMSDTRTRLEKMVGRRTLYELAAIKGDRRVLVAYCSGRGRRQLWAAITDIRRIDHVIRLTGAREAVFAKAAIGGATLGEWEVRFTGRTQREAIIEGELPYVAELD